MPVLSTTSTADTIPSFVTNNASYTQIGRLVFFSIHFHNDVGGTPGSGTNQVYCNLPFTSGASQLPATVQIGVDVNGTKEDIVYADINPTSSQLALLVRAASPNLVLFTCSELNDINIRHLSLKGEYSLGDVIP